MEPNAARYCLKSKARHDIEAQEVGEEIPHIVGQPEVVKIAGLNDDIVTRIMWRRLVSRHTTEQRIGPTCCLPRLLLILVCFAACAHTGGCIVLVEDTAFKVGRSKISHC